MLANEVIGGHDDIDARKAVTRQCLAEDGYRSPPQRSQRERGDETHRAAAQIWQAADCVAAIAMQKTGMWSAGSDGPR